MDYTLVKQVRDNAPLRESFFALARRVFGLSFEEWHRAGWWTDRYVPYTMVYRDGSAAANVSVNRIDTVWRGEALRLVQLGTVMTAPAHRGKGLARSLMEAVLDDWGRTCDGVYLYANGTVLEFYPKFGFVPAREHVCTLPLPARGAAPAEGGFARLDMDTQAGRALLLRCYERSNPFSALPMLDNPGLLMFYCSGFLKDCVYYSSAYDLACVATEEDGVFTCCDFFGTAAARWNRQCAPLPRPLRPARRGPSWASRPQAPPHAPARPCRATTICSCWRAERIFLRKTA